MNCASCGQPLPPGARFCTHCGGAASAVSGPVSVPTAGMPGVAQRPENYLVWAIVATVLTVICCQLGLPFGIVAIVYAAQVDSKAAGGDLAGALTSSENAKKWCWVTFIATFAGWILILLLWMLGFLGAFLSSGGIQGNGY